MLPESSGGPLKWPERGCYDPGDRAAQSGVPVDGVAFWSRASPLEFVRQIGTRTSVSGAVAAVRGVSVRRGLCLCATCEESGGDDIVKP
jgi:hypothetical protein